MVGYSVGRFGLFGVPLMQTRGAYGHLCCDIGCMLLLIGFVILVFVESDSGTDLQGAARENTPQRDETNLFQERYRQWRKDESVSPHNQYGVYAVETMGISQRGPVRFNSFGLYGDA